MNDKYRRYIEAGQRIRKWIVDYVALIPAGSQFAIKTAALTAVVNLLETLLGELEAAVGEGLSATDVKGSERLDLLELMEPTRDAARAAEGDVPGTRDRYRYTVNMSHQAFLAAGRSFALGGVDDEALLEGYGAPANWPALITAASDAYEAAFGQQDSAKGSSVAKKALIDENLDVFIALKRSVTHMVPSFCSSDSGAIAAWHSAAHIEEAPKKNPPTP